MTLLKKIKRLYWDFKRLNIRGLYYCLRFKKIKFPIIIERGCRFKNLKYLSTERGVIINENVEIFINPKRNEKREETALLTLGKFVRVGRYSSIGCSNNIILKDHVRIGPFVHLTDRNHTYEDISTPIWKQPISYPGPTIIEEESWIGYGSQIMAGVHIGKHCVVGAGSIVTKDIPDFCLAAGVPAKILKKYNFKTNKWEKV